MADRSYTFGDSALAAARLALLAEVFSEPTTGFLHELRELRPRVAVDLGCGPGFTTALVRDVLAPQRVVGIDSSAAFVREAAHRLGPSAELICADVVDLPRSIDAAGLLFARLLLSHLSDPVSAIEHWLTRLAPDGAIALEEVESITTEEPVFEAYLGLQRQMLEANHQRLEVGPVIEEAAQLRGSAVISHAVSLIPPTPMVARMFAMNFPSWRAQPVVLELASADELAEIDTGLTDLCNADRAGASITWQLSHVVITRS